MKPQKIVLPLLLLSLPALQPAHAAIVSQSCQDNYEYYGFYDPPVLVSTTCNTDSTYALQGTAILRNTRTGAPGLTFNVLGTLNQSASITTDAYSGYSYGQTSNNMTFGVTGIGTYTMSSVDTMANGSQDILGPVTNSLTGGFTTDGTTKWSIWSDGINAMVFTLDGDSDGIPGFNLYFNGAEYYVADVQMTAVPVPAAFWLFGSGLMGLFAAVRRKRVETH